MKFDLSQFEVLDKTELLEITGGYYGTSGTYVPDSYVQANATNYQPTVGSTTASSTTSTSNYTSSTSSTAAVSSVKPAGYDAQTGWIDRGANIAGDTGPINPNASMDPNNNQFRREQDDPIFNHGLDSGCAYMSALYAVESEVTKRSGKEFHFSANQILTLEKDLQVNKLLGEGIEDDRVKSWDGVLLGALRTAGYGNVKAKFTLSNTANANADYTIITNPQLSHFQFGDNKGNLISDPLGKDTITNQVIRGSIDFN